MKRKFLIIILAVFVITAFTAPAVSQAQEQKQQLYLVWDYTVKPTKVVEFENALTAAIEYNAKYGYSFPWYLYSTMDLHYYFVTPIGGHGDIDVINNEFAVNNKKAGKEFEVLWNAIAGTYNSVEMGTFNSRPELSYIVDKDITATEHPYTFWVWCSVIPGKETQFEENFKKWIELLTKNNMPPGFDTYTVSISKDMPLYFYMERGKSAGEFWGLNDKSWEVLGEEAQVLWIETMSYLRKIETKTGMFRPELSYTPEIGKK